MVPVGRKLDHDYSVTTTMVKICTSARMRFAELHKNKMVTNCSDSLNFQILLEIANLVPRVSHLITWPLPASLPFHIRTYKKKRIREKSKDSLLESHNYKCHATLLPIWRAPSWTTVELARLARNRKIRLSYSKHWDHEKITNNWKAHIRQNVLNSRSRRVQSSDWGRDAKWDCIV